MSGPWSLPAVPAQLFRAPSHLPTRPTVATKPHGHPVPPMEKTRVRGLSKTLALGSVAFCGRKPAPPQTTALLSPGHQPLLCSSLLCMPWLLERRRGRTKGKPSPSLAEPALTHTLHPNTGSDHISWCTLRGLGVPPKTCDICPQIQKPQFWAFPQRKTDQSTPWKPKRNGVAS